MVLSEEDIACLQNVAEVLSDVVSNLILMEGDSYPTLSMAAPIMAFLKGGPFRAKVTDCQLVKELRNTIEDYVDMRYPMLPLHHAATVLDPRFVQLSPFVPQCDREDWTHVGAIFIKEVADGLPSTDLSQADQASPSTSGLDPEPPTKKVKAENPFF